MGTFSKISAEAFSQLELEAGMFLNTFDPSNPTAPEDSAIVCATSGGLTVTCTPTYTDFGEDVDNCPNNMMEYKHLDNWTCTIAGTALDVTPAALAEFIGSAAVDSADTTKVTLDAAGFVPSARFHDRWWVGDRSDGGGVAVLLKKALSTGGMTLTTSKSGKGTVSFTYTGHVSVDAQDDMPMEFYSWSKSST